MKLSNLPKAAYLHIPFCRRRCYYCDFPISVLGNKTDIRKSSSISEYVEVLCREIIATPSDNSLLETVFFGGGTPSLLSPSYLEKILITLDKHLGIVPNAEISLEIDPGTFSLKQLQDYKIAGVNRISLGCQGFQDNLLEFCGRTHRIDDIFRAVDWINKVNFKNFSLDLISGLPHQTLEDWRISLETAIKIDPSHLSCYDLVLEPSTVFGKRYQPGKSPLPTDETTATMYRLGQQLLTEAGYQHYEISNYAKPGYQCRHNRVYWENMPYYGFGMGAASYTNQQRFTRPRTRKYYFTWVNQLSQSGGFIDCPKLSNIDILLENLMLRLRLSEGINLSLIKADFGEEITSKIIFCLSNYYQQNLINFIDEQENKILLDNTKKIPENTKLKLTDPEGFLFCNTVLATLFYNLRDSLN
ncbi:radical SAM family heme chaperone HemW [cyanobacterium endosymbiont of Epithemia clementina EcSB]|uniref:radical SAM family heme chaperone HemW n=1 Tax=cyanobacterium endosymbiont of Epithemia clementina EcSB TaxID=3034674 RepID=UPI002481813B|nr:radical SAM family heme chaperone HemW [cyanobacterium endosymbiont of Epithemia clementina EcSB]WGT66713.1 radical SAM family heme chaperone HemW [cyanobacterium endosymbiont of Epithemia clementina EcSB]